MQKEKYFQYTFAAIIFIITFLGFFYIDLKSLTIWSTNIWDTLYYTGSLRNYYAYSAQNLYGLEHIYVGSDILIYLPLAIWNFPLWLLQCFGGFSILEHPLMLLYSKLHLLVILFLTLKVTYKIMGLSTQDSSLRKTVLLLSFSSVFISSGIAYAGQNDIIVIFIFLCALYSLMKQHKRSFLILSSVSIALKPFFLFSYIALILLYEKKITKILLYGISGISLYFLQKLLFWGAPMYAESLSYGPTQSIFSLFLQYTLPIPPYGASFLILGLGIVFILSYFSTPPGSSLNSYIIYFALAPLFMIFLFTTYSFYRPIYLIPLLYICMMCKPQYLRLNLILDITLSACQIFSSIINTTLYYNPAYLLPLRTADDINVTSLSNFIMHFTGFGLPSLYSMVTAVFALSIGTILLINHPRFNLQNSIMLMPSEKWLLSLRMLIHALPVLLCFLSLFF